MLIGTLGVVVVLFIGWFYHHQVLLRDRAHLMREAIRNQEFTFRLPVKGLFFGERALQEALNETGRDIGRLLARNEVESWQRLTRVLTHEIMNATTPIASISQAWSIPRLLGRFTRRGSVPFTIPAGDLPCSWTVTGNWRNCKNLLSERSI